jgi:hypothetical protein
MSWTGIGQGENSSFGSLFPHLMDEQRGQGFSCTNGESTL